MSRLEFTGAIEQSTEEPTRHPQQPSRSLESMQFPVSASTVIVAAITVVVVLVLDQPIIRVDSRELNITSSLSSNETKERSLVIKGVVGQRLQARGVRAVNVRVNEFNHVVTVDNGSFESRMPLNRGANTIQAFFGNVASKPITVVANLSRSDIWAELTWDGPADIDLHLYLPNGEHCFFGNDVTTAGAKLDFDNKVRDGPEHIVMERAIRGQYRLAVHYYNLGGRAPGLPVNCRIVLKLKDGQVVRSFEKVLRQVGEEVNVDQFAF